ncbi:MAG: hypothetical protein RLY97_160 [Pseudomonadota bacterium]
MTNCNNCGCTDSKPIFAFKGYQLVTCQNCALTYVSNPPDEAALDKLYSNDANDYHADLLDPASFQYRRIARITRNHMNFIGKVANGGRLVDVGCSTGQFLGMAASMGFDASGIELSQRSADFARQQTGLSIERGRIHDTALTAESVDMLTMFDVIEHVTDPSSDIAAAYNLLKPGGWLVLSTPNIDGLFPRASYPLADALGYWPHPEPPHHLFQFSVKTLTAMLEKSGFEPGPVHHLNIDLAYSFGSASTLIRMPKRLAYAAVFAPLAKLGPMIGQGDWFYMAARKPMAGAGAMAA